MGCGDLRALGYPTGQQKLICHLDQLTSDALGSCGPRILLWLWITVLSTDSDRSVSGFLSPQAGSHMLEQVSIQNFNRLTSSSMPAASQHKESVKFQTW